MAVIPSFDAEGKSTDSAQMYLQGADTGSSIMARAQSSQRAQAELEMKQQVFDIQKPVLMAQAQAEWADAGAKLAATKRTADLRTEFANTAPQIMQEFQNVTDSGYINPPKDPDTGETLAYGTPDYQTKYDGYQALAAKYSKFGVLPAGKALIDELQKSAFDTHASMLADIGMKTHQAIAQYTQDQINARSLGMNLNRLDMQGLKNEGAEAVAGTRAGAQVQVGAGHDQARLGAAGIRSEAEQSRDYATRANNYLALAAQSTDKDERAALIKLSDGLFAKSQTAPATGAGKPLPTVSFSIPQSATPQAGPTVATPQPIYAVGTRVIQNGITYEFDGTNFNPVTK